MDPTTGDWRIFKSDGTRRRLGLRGPADREAAEKALADELILERLGSSAPRTTDKTPVMDLVYRYAEARADEVAKPQLLADAIEALSPFWTGKAAADINCTSCVEYTKWRMNGGLRKHHLKTRETSMSKAKISQSTARRDLTMLRAAVKFAQADGILLGTMPTVVLPDEMPARDRSLTRSEAARQRKSCMNCGGVRQPRHGTDPGIVLQAKPNMQLGCSYCCFTLAHASQQLQERRG